MQENGEPVLAVRDLRTWFHTRHGVARAVDGVDFTVNKGEVLCIVGESGCGKSVTALSIMRLIPPPGRVETGQLMFGGRDLLALSADEMAALRGQKISMIFQDPTSSLNPVFEVGAQISEVYEIHRDMTRRAGGAKAVEMLEKVGIPDPDRRAKSYPHEMSGGMAQRVMIAMALACEPRLLIADEPTTALDVTIQAQILDLMRGLQRETGTATVLITHDLGVVAELADRVAVMYAGEIVEETDVRTLFERPKHPYTEALLGSIPHLGRRQNALAVIPGTVPNLIDLPAGCRFASRCRARVEHALTICTQQEPDLRTVEPGHSVRCWLHRGEDESGVDERGGAP
jgi:oligopeptide/dipeptide ABC transporter ATP-binding protein